MHQVARTFAHGGGLRGAHLLGPRDTAQAELIHEAPDVVTADVDVLAAQLVPHLPDPVDIEVRLVHPLDLGLHPRILQRSLRRWPGLGRVVGGWGDRQGLADRLDPEDGAVLVDEPRHRLEGRSSSAAKKAEVSSTGERNTV